MMRFDSTWMVMLIAGLAFVGAERRSAGWNEAGHRLIALVAWELLSEDERREIVKLLKTHERFDQDFKPRANERVRANDMEMWVFARASHWSDIARGFEGQDRTTYHRSTWHYVNEPLYLTPADAAFFHDDLPANRDTNWSSGMPVSDMNVIQALKQCLAGLVRDDTGRPDKAIHLCWLFHLVGDLHQPLHATAMFSERLYPTGDKGGNWVAVTPGSNLHAFWDQALGGNASLKGLHHRVEAWMRDPSLVSVGEDARDNLNFTLWMKESHEAAWHHVYTEEILEVLISVTPHPNGMKPEMNPIGLTHDYQETAREVATERAVQAGYRLAALLKSLDL